MKMKNVRNLGLRKACGVEFRWLNIFKVSSTRSEAPMFFFKGTAHNVILETMSVKESTANE